ncbi:MAG TPA: urea ABC transporter permease subunit UrtB, partial [Rhodocyclaceae bacterium]|nr:urea ABC transporter permease subunit UrtB [Rhodocyclaceae bacterium]
MIKRLLFLLLCACSLAAHAALDAAQVRKLADDDSTEKVAAIRALVQSADPDALRVLQAMADDSLYVAGDKVVIVADDKAFDAASGAAIPMPDSPDSVTVNNRIRGELAGALAALRLFDGDPAVRKDSAQKLQTGATPELAPLLARALDKESDAGIKALLATAHAQATLGSPDPAVRLAAVRALADSTSPTIRSQLQALTTVEGEADEKVRYEAVTAVKAIESRLAFAENLGRVFSGLSLGSILLLIALGLAITYGVMGVINMAHGELLMVGAYSAYAMQSVFRAYFPDAIDWYLPAAVPVAFLAAALVGVVM